MLHYCQRVTQSNALALQVLIGEVVFGVALVLLLISLGLSFWEIRISVDALQLQLQDMETGDPPALTPPS